MSFIRFSVLDEISCGFAVFSDFLRGFSVSNRPLCPPLQVIVGPVVSCDMLYLLFVQKTKTVKLTTALD